MNNLESKNQQERGGDGGKIFISAKKIEGNGKILANGGSGSMGGKGGEVYIVSEKNNFTGDISAQGGKATFEELETRKHFIWKHWKSIVGIIFAGILFLFFGWQLQWKIPLGIVDIVPPSEEKKQPISSFILITSDLRIEILNRGDRDIYLLSTQFDHEAKSTMEERRIIPAGYSYFLDTESLAQWIGENIGMNGEKIVPFNIFLADTNSKKYVMKNMLYIKVKDSKVNIQPQTLSLNKEG